jgi:two-component sensor histidine kinase
MVGLSDVDSSVGTSIKDYFDPIQWPLIVETVFPAVDRDGSWRGELRFKHFQTGELIPVIYDVIALRDADGAVIAYATVTRDIRDQKDAENRQNILNQELAHRMKNTLALVQAIAMQTLKGVSEKDAVAAFTDRLQAISSAHNVLLQQSWAAAKLDEVVEAVLGTFHMEDRFTISGPETDLGPRATLSLSLLLHELATNAIKYGALSTEEGRVAVAWKRSGKGEGEKLSVRWKEHGGPPPVAPSHRGFGSRLISMGLIGTGGAQLDYLQDGFEGVFTAPLVQVQQS